MSLPITAREWVFIYEDGICAYYQLENQEKTSWVMLLDGASVLESALNKPWAPATPTA